MNARLLSQPPPLPPSAVNHPRPVRPPREHGAQIAERPRLLKTLRGLLRESFSLRNQGARYSALAHAQGYADGFMRALVDGGVLTRQELLELVQDVRRGHGGPALGPVPKAEWVSEEPAPSEPSDWDLGEA